MIKQVETYAQAVSISAFFFAHREPHNFLIPRSALFLSKHPWWFMEENGIIATVGLSDAGRVWRLVGLLVRPDMRNMGLGALLVRHIQAEAKLRKVPIKIATAIPDYFRRFGFQVYDLPFKSGIVKMQWQE